MVYKGVAVNAELMDLPTSLISVFNACGETGSKYGIVIKDHVHLSQELCECHLPGKAFWRHSDHMLLLFTSGFFFPLKIFVIFTVQNKIHKVYISVATRFSLLMWGMSVP